MSDDAFDLVVIGGGSGGYAGANLGAQLGLKTALVEGAREMGGLCILRGCMPSKAIIQSANRFLTLRRAAEFGLRAENLAVCGEEIIERKRRLVVDFARHRRLELERGRFELVRGWGKFVDAHTLDVQGEVSRQLRAKSFLIATGSELKIVNVPGLKETGFLDSDTVLESAHIPKSVIMLGAGPIALEFAHYYSALGSEVTIVQRGKQVLRDMDGDVAMAASGALEARGVHVFLGTTLTRVERSGAVKRVIFQFEGEERSVEAEEIVYGLGRVPNIEKLGLEAAGVKIEHGRLSIAATQQTNAPHIFAAGDAAGPHEIVHIAVQQAEVAVRNARRLVQEAAEPLEPMDYRLKLFVAFMEPQVASIGFTERELMTAGASYAVGKYAFADLGKAEVIGETAGFVKLIARSDMCEILGAAAVGPDASELIHELSAAMYFRATARDLLQIPHYHPTLSEIWTYPAEELVNAGP
ncbi:MAG: FAD-dependent oxidoreductase [Chthoniobacteraceae bacterium]|jgi:pyruvate/2-oxoglutarate dehydrogenase complex dihydrolipoamide dehydrogenase (E3) component